MDKPGLSSVQVVEAAEGIFLFGFDAEDRCVVSAQGLEECAAGSLHSLVNAAFDVSLTGLDTREHESAALYDLVTGADEGWDIIAECTRDADGEEQYFAYVEDMYRPGLRLAGEGYILGLLVRKEEGARFDHAGVGSFWEFTYRSPIEAEEALDELGQDCEVHAVADLLAIGCELK